MCMCMCMCMCTCTCVVCVCVCVYACVGGRGERVKEQKREEGMKSDNREKELSERASE